MLNDHVHCASCRRPIATVRRVSGGRLERLTILTGTELALAKGPGGITPVERRVPLCPACAKEVERQQRERSRIIIPH